MTKEETGSREPIAKEPADSVCNLVQASCIICQRVKILETPSV